MDPIDEDEGNGFEFNDIIDEIAINDLTIGKVKSAIQRMKNGKSLGVDSIKEELLKAGGDFSAGKIDQLMTNDWRKKSIPTKWKQGTIIKLAKKGNLKECKNSRGITLLSANKPVIEEVEVLQNKCLY